MGELLPILMLIFVAVPTVISFNQAKNKQQEQQKNRQAQQRQQAAEKKPDTVLPPRERAPMRPTLQPTLHDHSGMYDGSLFADDGTEGTDPHDHGFDHEVDMPSEHSAEIINQSLKGRAPKPSPSRGPVLNFNPQNIASAFVLQEVLKRK